MEARLEKARRGELVCAAPVGYLKTEDQRLEKDPDRRVQQAIKRVFAKFMEYGTVRQTLMWFLEHGLQVPAQNSRGETYWRRPVYRSMHRMLTHPTYGGAYAYGKTESLVRYANGQSTHICRRKPRERWLALLPNAHEGYVTWEEFERIQVLIRENLPGAGRPGAAKNGLALLSGLLRCARCGRKLTVRYTGSDHAVLRYSCHRGWLDNGEPRCIAFGGIPVDDAISKQIIRVVQPAAIDAAVAASQETAKRRDDIAEALNRDLEAARYAAQRAQRQYDAADPENRLVTTELERRWNVALERVQEIEEQIRTHHQGTVSNPVATREQFAELARKLEKIWNDPDTDVRLKKRIIRTLIEEVIADVNSTAGEVILIVHWKGGVHTEIRVPRRRRGQSNAQTPGEVVDAVTSLARICSDELIAGMLNRNGLKTGRGNRWTKERVAALRSHYRIPCCHREDRVDEGWMNLTQAAAFLKISPRTLRLAIDRGEIKADHPLDEGPWILRKCDLESELATSLVQRARQGGRPAAIPADCQDQFDFLIT